MRNRWFENLGTNLGFLVPGTSGAQTLESVFSKLGTMGFQFHQSAIRSQLATKGSELGANVGLKELQIFKGSTI